MRYLDEYESHTNVKHNQYNVLFTLRKQNWIINLKIQELENQVGLSIPIVESLTSSVVSNKIYNYFMRSGKFHKSLRLNQISWNLVFSFFSIWNSYYNLNYNSYKYFFNLRLLFDILESPDKVLEYLFKPSEPVFIPYVKKKRKQIDLRYRYIIPQRRTTLKFFYYSQLFKKKKKNSFISFHTTTIMSFLLDQKKNILFSNKIKFYNKILRLKKMNRIV